MMHPHVKRVIPIAVFLALWLAWFAWYRLTTDVVTYEERYPGGALKLRGLVKRQPGGAYKRHGAWREYELDGRVRVDRVYVDGVERSTASDTRTSPAASATLPSAR